MRIPFFLLFALMSCVAASAQKQTYQVFAFTQKMTKDICGTSELIKDAEVELSTEEAAVYKANYQKELRATYNSKNRYNNTFVEIVKPTQAVIFYESKKVYYPSPDMWDCTNTQYACIIANDMAAAEAQFAALKNEYKKSEFKEIKRWGKTQRSPASVKAEDVSISWKQTGKGIIAFLTNTRTDMAFTVLVKGLKKDPKATAGKPLEMIATEKYSITIQPGEKLTLNLKMADGFNVEAVPVPVTKEQEGLIEKGKNLLRQYFREQGKAIYQGSTGIGVRG
jgi:hypothetical protein